MGYVRVYLGNDLKKQFELGEDRVTIGRTDDNVLVLADAGVSKQHAVIEYRDGDYYIADLGSSNGVFLNNERIETSKLKYWDEIQIHNFVIKFMSKPGIGAANPDDTQGPAGIGSDKTEVYKLTDEKQLESLRHKTKRCFLTFKDKSGTLRKLFINKPRTVLGKSSDVDVRVAGWFAPSVSATIERQGNTYQLVPKKRGNVVFKGLSISEPTRLTDDSEFSVRGMEFKFFNRLTKTS